MEFSYFFFFHFQKKIIEEFCKIILFNKEQEHGIRSTVIVLSPLQTQAMLTWQLLTYKQNI